MLAKADVNVLNLWMCNNGTADGERRLVSCREKEREVREREEEKLEERKPERKKERMPEIDECVASCSSKGRALPGRSTYAPRHEADARRENGITQDGCIRRRVFGQKSNERFSLRKLVGGGTGVGGELNVEHGRINEEHHLYGSRERER